MFVNKSLSSPSFFQFCNFPAASCGVRPLRLCGSVRVSQINKSNQIPFPFCSQLIELSILSDLDHLLSNMRMDSRLTREVTKGRMVG